MLTCLWATEACNGVSLWPPLAHTVHPLDAQQEDALSLASHKIRIVKCNIGGLLPVSSGTSCPWKNDRCLCT